MKEKCFFTIIIGAALLLALTDFSGCTTKSFSGSGAGGNQEISPGPRVIGAENVIVPSNKKTDKSPAISSKGATSSPSAGKAGKTSPSPGTSQGPALIQPKQNPLLPADGNGRK